tara:strand:- start:733 stop:2133 length:1401 start_codon:yes stop_codon:yes gene_type:complete
MRNDIRNLRKNHKLTIDELAKKSDVSASILKKCERGLIIPKMDFFTKIGKTLGVDPSKILRAHKNLKNNPLKTGEGYLKDQGNPFLIQREITPDNKKIPIIDVFCGTGGFSHGFEQTKKFQVVSAIDLLKDRCETFHANHPTANVFCSNIQKFDTKKLDYKKKPQIIIGGPPCQGFSSIRPFRSLNQNDSRNNLFESFAIVLDQIKPKWFVLENVVGLLTHDGGSTMKRMIQVLEDLGFTISWSVINGVNYGLPQRRERLIMVGNVDGEKFVFPKPIHFDNGRSMAKINNRLQNERQNLLAPISVTDAIGDLPKISSGESSLTYDKNSKQTNFSKKMRGNQKKLTLHNSTRHSDKILEIIQHAGSNINSIPKKLVTSGFSTSYSRLAGNEPSVTITVNFSYAGSNRCIHPTQNRALTQREALRLQGFEDSYIFKGTKSQINKQIGNAVSPIMGNIIAKQLLKYIKN